MLEGIGENSEKEEKLEGVRVCSKNSWRDIIYLRFEEINIEFKVQSEDRWEQERRVFSEQKFLASHSVKICLHHSPNRQNEEDLSRNEKIFKFFNRVS